MPKQIFRWSFDVLGHTFWAEHDLTKGVLVISTRSNGVDWQEHTFTNGRPVRPVAIARAALLVSRMREAQQTQPHKTESLDELTKRLRVLKARMNLLKQRSAII